MNTAVHFSSKTDEWATPQPFFDALNAEFHFTLDVAADATNAKCARYFTQETDGLAQDWGKESCWCNPPYSQLAKWLTKAADAAKKGATVVMLIPSRTDTKAFHAHVWDADNHCTRPGVSMRLVPGRLKFGSAASSAPFPSMLAIFRPLSDAERAEMAALREEMQLCSLGDRPQAPAAHRLRRLMELEAKAA